MYMKIEMLYYRINVEHHVYIQPKMLELQPDFLRGIQTSCNIEVWMTLIDRLPYKSSSLSALRFIDFYNKVDP